MSLASCSYQCGWISNEMGFTVSLLGNEGDLYQRFSGKANAPSNVTPPWNMGASQTGPILRVILMGDDPSVSQTTLADAVVDSETSYFIDGVKLSFDGNGLSTSLEGGDTSYAGCFRKLTAAAGANHNAAAPFGGLEVRKNLVTPTDGRTVNVSVRLGLSTGNKGFHKQGSTRIAMIRSNGSSNFAHIFCDAGQSFVLDKDANPSVTCKVNCWEGDNAVATFYRKWYIMEGGVWVQKATTDTFAVTHAMVNSFADVKVECYSDSERTKPIASDVQTVNDSSDALILSPNPTPADGTFVQNGTVDVSFNPTLQTQDGSAVPDNFKYAYAVMDSAGNTVLQVTEANAIPKGTSFTVDRTVANGMEQGPIVNIEAFSV